MVDAATGQQIGRLVSGQEDAVDIRSHLSALVAGRRHVQFHSHPGSSAFSDADAAILLSWPSIHALVVVGVDGSWYALSRAAPVVETARQAIDAYWIERDAVDAEHRGWSHRERTHLVWTRIADRLGLRYDRMQKEEP